MTSLHDGGGKYQTLKKKQNENIEIDVIARSIDGKHLLIGECKWTNHEDGQRVLSELKQKASKLPFINEYTNVHYVLFLKEEPTILPDCQYLLPDDIVGLLK